MFNLKYFSCIIHFWTLDLKTNYVFIAQQKIIQMILQGSYLKCQAKNHTSKNNSQLDTNKTHRSSSTVGYTTEQ